MLMILGLRVKIKHEWFFATVPAAVLFRFICDAISRRYAVLNLGRYVSVNPENGGTLLH